jgi:hypothetical protein
MNRDPGMSELSARHCRLEDDDGNKFCLISAALRKTGFDGSLGEEKTNIAWTGCKIGRRAPVLLMAEEISTGASKVHLDGSDRGRFWARPTESRNLLDLLRKRGRNESRF